MSLGTGLPGIDPEGVVADGPSAADAGASLRETGAAISSVSQNLGAVLQAHQDTVDAGQMAFLKSGADVDLATLRAANSTDPAAFAQARAQYKSQMLQSVPGRYAVQIGSYIDTMGGAIQGDLIGATVARQQALQTANLQARQVSIKQAVAEQYASGRPLAAVAADPTVVSLQQEFGANQDALVKAGALAPEQDKLDTAQAVAGWQASAITGHILQIKQQYGAAAAESELRRIEAGGVPNPDGSAPVAPVGSFESGAEPSAQGRSVGVSKAREALSQTISDDAAQTSIANAAALAAQHVLTGQTATELDHLQHFGTPSGSGPTDAQFQAAYPNDWFGPLKTYTDAKAAAIAQHHDDSITPGMSSDDIAAQSAAKAALKPLDVTLNSPEKIGGLNATVEHLEGGVDAQGRPLVGPDTPSGHAYGKYQLLVGTARQIAQAHGLTQIANMSDAQLQTELMQPDQRTNTRLGQLATGDLAAKYGSAPKVLFAYHNGFYYENGQIVSHPVDKAVSLYGEPEADLPTAQWVQKLAAGSPGMGPAPKGAQYVQDGADFMDTGQKIAAAQAYQLRANQVTAAAVNDPVGFGAAHGWGQPAPINPNGFLPTASPQDKAAFAQAIQLRAAQSVTTGQQHPGIPPRLLSNADAASFRAMLKANPAIGPDLAGSVMDATNPSIAQSVMREIGAAAPTANVGVQTAWLGTIPNARPVVEAIKTGLRADANGQKDAPLPKVNGHAQSWTDVSDAVSPAFRFVPNALASVIGTAKMAHLGDAQGGAPDVPDAYVRSVLGGTQNHTGQKFGGVAPVNGNPTIYPSWMSVGAMPDAARALGDQLGPNGPVFDNKSPMRGRDLAGMQFYQRPSGGYWMADPRTGKQVKNAQGQPYEINFDQAKSWLTQHVPGVAGQGL